MTDNDRVSGTMHLTDAQFLRALESCSLRNEEFRHFDHVRLAWIVAQRATEAAAVERIETLLRRFAAYHGKEDRFHHTMTHVWTRLVARAIPSSGGDDTFEAFIALNSGLLDRTYPTQFYSESRLMSADARAAWLEPDLRPLPSPPPLPPDERSTHSGDPSSNARHRAATRVPAEAGRHAG